MRKILYYIFFTTILVWVFSACKNDKESEIISSENVRISAFSLAKDTTVLNNLEKVFFTIDLENGLIYNADSLPKGTNVRELAITITTEDSSTINIVTLDTTYNYRSNRSKKLDLSVPIRAEVISRSGLQKKSYQIKVNVHNVEPDRLVWGSMQYSTLPGEGNLTEQKTVQYNGLVHCFMKRDDRYYLATAITPAQEWLTREIALSFTPNLRSLTVSDGALYMLDNEGNLHTSIDGETWSDTGNNYSALIGSLNNQLHTLTLVDGQYYHDIYPQPAGYTLTPIRSDFPVSGFSDMLSYNSSWLTYPQGMIVGGRTADGNLTGAMWGYDGTTWAKLSDAIPAREGASFFPYYTFYVDANWITSEKITWFVIGGHNESGSWNEIWVSNNYGITWQKGGEDLYMPGYIGPRGYISAIVCNEPINSTLGSWNSFEVGTLPQGYKRMPMYSSTARDEAPYIYLFGGETRYGQEYNEIWRGVINRLRFEPIP